MPDYAPSTHHNLIAEKLDDVVAGKVKRLMIFMPPRFGKSELASKRFPAYFLGRNPSRNIIAASYNSDLAADFGREVRGIVNSDAYRGIFPDVSLSEDSKAANRWHTSARGMYTAAGIGTATTGRGADVFLIDDPLKDREEADSQLRRDRVWRWYTSTAYTRLESDVQQERVLEDDWIWESFQRDVNNGKAQGFEGAIVLIQTRWHEDDLAGRLLVDQARGGDQWDILELPAILTDDKGNESSLWPSKFSLSRLERIRGVVGTRDWTSLYMQAPAPDEGVFFKREHIQHYDKIPDGAHYYGASDYAVTADAGDYTVHIVGAVDQNDNLYIADVWRGQTESNVWVDAFCGLVRRYGPLKWAEEQGQIIKSLGPFIHRRMHELRVYCNREQFTSVSDKAVRARSFQARLAQGKVFLPTDAAWVADFEAELLNFPVGKHDDQVDAAGLLGRLLDKMHGGRPNVRSDKIFDPWERSTYNSEGSWKTV